MDIWLSILAGLAAAAIVTGWQGYKDSPWEGFIPGRFARSYVVALSVGLVCWCLNASGMLVFDNAGVLLLSVLSFERGIGELYKGFIRRESHPEYEKLFERLHIEFRSQAVRAVAGILVALVVAASILIVLSRVLSSALLLPHIPAGLIAGLSGGLLSATGGAIKDSQFEGFRIKKFIRSPIVGMLGGMILVHLTDNPLLLLLGCTGFERVAVELYKTFLTRQIRGIFCGQEPKYRQWLQSRWVFAMLYSTGAISLVILLLR